MSWYDSQIKESYEKNGVIEVNNPLDFQVGGDHYKNQGLQPFEITYANFGYEGIRASVYTKVNKYLTRKKSCQQENIEKAIHCLQIQLEFLVRDGQKPIP